METSSFTNKLGQKIFTRYWPIEAAAKAVVIIVHGLGEHSGRYTHVAEALNEAGYICYALDHRGHGHSEGARFQVSNYDNFIDDLKLFYDSIKEKHSDNKIFILGHSMGSVISLQFVYTYPDTVDCLTITGTATDVKAHQPAWLVNFLTGVHVIFPQAPLGPPLNDPAKLTRNKHFQDLWLKDNLVNKGNTPISILKYILDTGVMLQANAQKISLPMLIMHGECDEIAPPSGTTIMYDRVSSTDKETKVWPEMRHEIMNEIGYEEVLANVVNWFDKH